MTPLPKTRAECAEVLQKQLLVLGRIRAEKGWRCIVQEDVREDGRAQLRRVTHWALVSGRRPKQMVDLIGGDPILGLFGFGGAPSPHLRLVPCDRREILWDVIEVSPPGETSEEFEKRFQANVGTQTKSDLLVQGIDAIRKAHT